MIKTYIDDLERRKREIIPGTSDTIFKKLFTTIDKLVKEVIVYVVEDIKMEDLREMKIISNELPKENIEEKGKISDLVIEIENKIINIEMNKKYYKKIIKKNNSYITKIQSLYEDKIVIQINIDNYTLYKEEGEIVKFELRSEKGIVDKSFIKKYHVNLEVIYKKYYNKEKLTRMEKIFLMLKLVNKKELYNLSRGDELMERIYDELIKLSNDKRNLLSYSKEELYLMCAKEEGENEGIKKGRIQGLEEGRQEGIYEGIKEGIQIGISRKENEIIRNMLNRKMDINLISEITNIPIEQIELVK